MKTIFKTIKFAFLILIISQNIFAHNQTILINPVNNQIQSQSLSDNWSFYWMKFIDPNHISESIEQSLNVSIPSYWSDFKLKDKNFPGIGYGSYSKTIILPKGYRQSIGLSIPIIDVAYCFYINGKLITSSGKVGVNYQDEIPGYSSKLIEYYPQNDTLNIVFHVSNFHHRRGGIWKDFDIGPYSLMEKHFSIEKGIDFISLGILLSFGIFFLMFSFYNKEEKSLFFISISFLFILLRGICTNHFAINIFLPISWKWMIRLEYISNFGGIVMGMWGFFYIKPINWIRKALLAFTAGMIIIVPFILIFDVPLFAYSLYLFNVYLFCFLSLFCIQIVNMIKNHDRIPWYFVIGVFMVTIAAFNDLFIAFSKVLVFDFYILPTTFIVFVFVLSAVFFRRFSTTYENEKKLTKELSTLNSELESIVEERTARLVSKKQIIESQNELLQKDLCLKNRILSIIGHDIRSPLSFIVMGLELIKDENLPDDTRKNFINKILFAGNNLFLLVDNLLSWGTSQNKQLKIFPEECNLSILSNRVIDQFQPIADNKGLLMKSDVPNSAIAWFDENTITIVIRNLISNGVKFTPTGGTIMITVVDSVDFIEFKVTDTGIGIPIERLKLINEGHEINSKEGTNQEKGTGLGLILCKELITLNGGMFSIQSEINAGSTFSFTLPKKKSS